MEAIERGMTAPEAPKPPRPDRSSEVWTHESRERLKALKQWRTELGQELELAVSHIWPTPSLERIALKPDRLDYELDGGDGEIRRWQREEFGDGLSRLVSPQ
jgi:ribonuclease D